MAIRYAVASGNWSSTATWNGGTLPADTDDVYSNGFVVSIDQSITVNSLKKISNGSPAIAVGGSFSITAGVTVTITAGIAAADAVTNSQYLLLVNAGAASVTLNANIVGGASTNRVAVRVDSTFTGALTINGNLTGGSGGTAYALDAQAASASVAINGHLLGGSGAATAYAINANGSLTITGDVTGGSTAAAINFGVSSATIRGELRPGNSATGVPAIISEGTTAFVRYSGHIYSGGMAVNTGPNGFFPIRGSWTVMDGEDVFIHVFNDDNFPSGNNGTQTVLTRYGTSNPAIEDVRAGVVYGVDSQLEGTLAVPPPASVASGVPTDDTVGTAALSLADVAALTGAQIAAATTA